MDKIESFFSKHLAVSKIVSTFALAFEKLSVTQSYKERVLWKILHKQTSSTRSGFGLHLIIYREYEETG